ncbi:tail fiber assembly protein [Enterobacter sp.]|uniref:tail fiber assembly protein n=1 Tax=Enterobacter sp. TaxID=42895 RepID=UPI002981C6B4|nr:tail fiber assembly protein [Enterobacter sp.]
MRIYYSAASGGFYPDFLKENYNNVGGGWPADAVEITQRWYEYLLNAQAEGQIIVPNEYGQPVLADVALPTHDDLLRVAEQTRQKFIDDAMQSIGVIQLKQMNGRKISDEEAVKVNAVLDCIERLEALDLSAAPDIEWPEVPGNVA